MLSCIVTMKLVETVPVTEQVAAIFLNDFQQFRRPAEKVTSVSSVSIVHAAESLTVSDRMDYCEMFDTLWSRGDICI